VGVTDTESRRQSILEATIRVVGRQGYADTSVADLIAEAGVSRTTFYNHFRDRHECFRAAYPIVVERVLGAVAGACGDEPWLQRVRSGLDALVGLLAAEPELARTALVEVAVAGGEPLDRKQAALERLAQLLEPGDDVPRSRELPAGTAKMAVGAVAGLLFDEIQAGHTADLRDWLPDLRFALLVPYLGPRVATTESHAVRAA